MIGAPIRAAVIMVRMSIWATSVLLPLGVSIAGTLLTGLTVGPRLAARAKRIQAAHDSRDVFGESVLNILALCHNLENVVIPPEVGGQLLVRLQRERDRWIAQIDEATIWLVDHWQQSALTYVQVWGVAGVLSSYAGRARGLWLSDRPIEQRVRILKEMTEPVQTVYFASRWRAMINGKSELARLRAMLDADEAASRLP